MFGRRFGAPSFDILSILIKLLSGIKCNPYFQRLYFVFCRFTINESIASPPLFIKHRNSSLQTNFQALLQINFPFPLVLKISTASLFFESLYQKQSVNNIYSLMARFVQLTREQFNEYKRIKACNTPLLGEHWLYGKRNCKKKYIGKSLTEQQFPSTRHHPIQFYKSQHDTIFFFECQGESLQNLFNYKTENINSKTKNSELLCWMTKYKNFEQNLEEIFKYGVKLEAQQVGEIVLGCFRVVKQKLVYHYDGWMRGTAEIVKRWMGELEKYYFSPTNLQEIKQNVELTVNRKTMLFRLAMMIVHLGTRELNLRLYEFGEYAINVENLHKRLEVFRVKYPRLHGKIERILDGNIDKIEELEKVESFSTIHLTETNFKARECSSLLEDSFLNKTVSDKENGSVNKRTITLFYSDEKKSNCRNSSKSREKSSSKTREIHILSNNRQKHPHPQSSPKPILQNLDLPTRSLLNLRQIFSQKPFSPISQLRGVSLFDYLQLISINVYCLYEQRLLKLLKQVILQDSWLKRLYSNQSIYIGEFVGENREGKGIYVFQSGDVYYGGWKQNKMHGFGKYIYRNGEYYEGELYEGMKHGHGGNEYLSGNVYEGSWVNNRKEGLGVVRYANCNMFVGVFYGGRREAEGVYVNKDGEVKEGTLFNQVNQNHKKQLKVDGILISEASQAQGKLKIVELETEQGTYRGQTLNEKRQGYGVLESLNETFEGYWKNDLKHGQGKLKTPGFVIEGVWEQGFFVQYTPTL